MFTGSRRPVQITSRREATPRAMNVRPDFMDKDENGCSVCGATPASQFNGLCAPCDDPHNYVCLQDELQDFIQFRDRLNQYDLSELTIDDAGKVFRFTPEQICDLKLLGLTNFTILELRAWEETEEV